jgi:zeaxanthin epoxidase
MICHADLIKSACPPQIQSNALGALEAIDPTVADEIMRHGCITGDRINGLCDGVTGDWYVKFDTFHPAADAGLPVTRVINRVSLQNVLAKAAQEYGGPETILGDSHVVSYSEVHDANGASKGVSVQLEDGRVFTGDILVGADGIRSKIRKQMLGESNVRHPILHEHVRSLFSARHII